MSKVKITICVGSSCFARGNSKNAELAEKFIAERGLREDVDVELEGSLCTGNCAKGPVVIIDGVPHFSVDEKELMRLLNELFPASKKE
ncbi:MAG: (2Fe-2S) ferredoxin domain-containing protein [Victivallales bacterium]|nr:(2Fe-2S) ferredoxin domain-containing protein [Victivallales bacterium]